MLKPHEQWPDPSKSKQALLSEMEAVLANQPGNAYEISQPIQLRFNELISVVRLDLGVKIYGDDWRIVLASGNRIAACRGVLEAAGRRRWNRSRDCRCCPWNPVERC